MKLHKKCIRQKKKPMDLNHTTAIFPWCDAKGGKLIVIVHFYISQKMVWNNEQIWIITTIWCLYIKCFMTKSSLTSTTWGPTFVHTTLKALKCSSRHIVCKERVTKSNFPSLTTTWWILWKTGISQWTLTQTTKPGRYTVPLCLAHLTFNTLVSTGTWSISAIS